MAFADFGTMATAAWVMFVNIYMKKILNVTIKNTAKTPNVPTIITRIIF